MKYNKVKKKQIRNQQKSLLEKKLNILKELPEGMTVVSRQAIPAPIMVRQSGHLRPILSKNKMLIPIEGNSTAPVIVLQLHLKT